MAETGASDSSSPDTDRDFDPSAEMLIHDFDDERTLEEEEGLSGDSSCSNELDDLQKEGEMPLEALLMMYRVGAEPQDTRSSSEEEILSNQDLTLDKEEIARDLLKNNDSDDKETSVNDLLDSVSSSQTARLLRSASQPGSEVDDTDDEEDIDYEPADDDWKKVIQVGSDYQAPVPEGMCKYGDAPAYENEDRLLWDPSKLDNPLVEKYLEDIHEQTLQNSVGVNSIPTGTHIRDDEQALYLLLQCGHNIEEALRRRKMQAIPPTDPMSLWSEEECRNFENGLRTYGKDFYLIQQNKVRTRSVGELVQFYYLWKKTERHDVYANKNRLEKRKYTFHPGVTDYMDRFIDDQETPPLVRDRSSSPLNYLIYGDPKRNQSKSSPDHHDSQTTFQPIEPSEMDLNTAVPTTICVSPQMKVRNAGADLTNLNCDININGNRDDLFEPVSKKLKTDAKDIDYGIHEHFRDTSNHIDSLPLSTVTDLTNISDNGLTSFSSSSSDNTHSVSQTSSESLAQ
ncbi:hypothetical protein ScPMuIL_007166 [Solemya velum]